MECIGGVWVVCRGCIGGVLLAASPKPSFGPSFTDFSGML